MKQVRFYPQTDIYTDSPHVRLRTDFPQHVPSLTTHKHQPPQLPLEIWEYVFGYLDLMDIQFLRLASRIWTDIGSRFLFQPFVFRPDRDHLAHFECLFQNPVVFRSIYHLRFELSTLPMIYAPHNIGFANLAEQESHGLRGRPDTSAEASTDMMEL